MKFKELKVLFYYRQCVELILLINGIPFEAQSSRLVSYLPNDYDDCLVKSICSYEENIKVYLEREVKQYEC